MGRLPDDEYFASRVATSATRFSAAGGSSDRCRKRIQRRLDIAERHDVARKIETKLAARGRDLNHLQFARYR